MDEKKVEDTFEGVKLVEKNVEEVKVLDKTAPKVEVPEVKKEEKVKVVEEIVP